MLSRRRFLLGLVGLGAGAVSAAALRALHSLPARSKMLWSPLAVWAAEPRVREALYYEAVEGGGLDCASCHDADPSRVRYCHTPHTGRYVRCRLCPRGCIISEGQRGECRVRENRGGRLHTVVYGYPCARAVDPIEKKPFYHFLPGSLAYSIATAGCNLHCLYCQNWEISQATPEETGGILLPPEALAADAVRTGAQSVAYTYSEPTVFYEYMLDAAQAARKLGLRNVVISAGYINPAPLRELCSAVDAIKIDFKGYSDDFYRQVCAGTLDPVLDAMRTIRAAGTHLEIVNLVVPTLNDDEAHLRGLSRWVVENLGPDVPVHFSRFHPLYRLTHLPPTPVETLEQAWRWAKTEGVRYAYVGNVPGHPADNTTCHACGELLIRRAGYTILENHLADGRCPRCGETIPGVWQ